MQIDRYGRAWVPYFEGMARNFAAYDIATRFYSPSDVDELCPDVFEQALETLSVDACDSRGRETIIANILSGTLMPWTLACAGVCEEQEYIEPG